MEKNKNLYLNTNTNTYSKSTENNFLFKIMKSSQKESKNPKMLNKGFIMEKDRIKEESEDKISKINSKVNSMIKSQDNYS